MKAKLLSREQLLDYCKRQGIYVGEAASKRAMEAAIHRALVNGSDPPADAEIGCFGYHDPVDGNCITCRFREPCAEATLGVPIEKYHLAIKKLDNPKWSFKPMAKKRKG